jgi:1-acyl-sn-glycerol-3-phosphate acyltransferase
MAPITLLRWDIRAHGLEHVPAAGGAVLALNHSSFVDFFTAARPAYLALDRPVRILAKASLFRTPVVATAMRLAGHIPVDRGAGAAALDRAIAALRAGEMVGVLPEQTISPSFELLPFKSGAARMAQAAGVPLVPTVSWGSHRFWTMGDGPHPIRRLHVAVAYGEALRPGSDDDPEEVTAELRTRIGAMLHHVQETYPDGAPAGAPWVPARLGGGAPTVEEAEVKLAALRAQWRAAHPQGRRGRGSATS